MSPVDAEQITQGIGESAVDPVADHHPAAHGQLVQVLRSRWQSHSYMVGAG